MNELSQVTAKHVSTFREENGSSFGTVTRYDSTDDRFTVTEFYSAPRAPAATYVDAVSKEGDRWAQVAFATRREAIDWIDTQLPF